MNKTLIIDTNNIFWLSRGFHTEAPSLDGEWPISAQFFTIINSYLRIHQPDSVFFLGEGFPEWRYLKFPEYKKERPILREADPLNEAFIRQKRDVRNILKNIMPFYYIQHPQLEADDIAYLICKFINDKNIDSEIVCISTDKDWEQNMVYFDNVSIWQPITKKWKEKPDDNFVAIKSLCGDKSDGIDGFKGIGPKTAKKLLTNEDKWEEWYDSLTDSDKQKYEANKFIIDFNNIPKEFQDNIYNNIECFELPQLKWSYFKSYCAERKMFRFLKKMDEKINFYQKLGPIMEHKIISKEIFI